MYDQNFSITNQTYTNFTHSIHPMNAILSGQEETGVGKQRSETGVRGQRRQQQ
jgi:hypothetical protein